MSIVAPRPSFPRRRESSVLSSWSVAKDIRVVWGLIFSPLVGEIRVRGINALRYERLFRHFFHVISQCASGAEKLSSPFLPAERKIRGEKVGEKGRRFVICLLVIGYFLGYGIIV
jgi:hypothetical protein